MAFDIGAFELPAGVGVDGDPSGTTLLGFTVQLSMKGNYRATVNYANPTSDINGDLRNRTFKLDLDCFGAVEGYGYASDLFHQNSITWIDGVIDSVTNDEDLGQKMASLEIISKFARLSKRPVNTEKQEGSERKSATVNATISKRSGVPDSQTDFESKHEGEGVCGPVEGDNTLEEMKQVAQAGSSTLFVDKSGKLVTKPWKDHNDAVEFTIPNEAVKKASKAQPVGKGPSSITVRGCQKAEKDEGEKEMAPGGNQGGGGGSGGGGGGHGGARGKVTMCMVNGAAAPNQQVNLNELNGNAGDIRNARYTTTGAGSYSRTTRAGDGTATIELEGTLEGEQETEISVQGEQQPEHETNANPSPRAQEIASEQDQKWDAAGRGARNTGSGGRRRRKLGEGKNYRRLGDRRRANRNAGALKPEDIKEEQRVVPMGKGGRGGGGGGPAGGKGSAGGGGHKNPSKTGDEKDENRNEVVVTDSQLMAEVGCTKEQIDNKYIRTKEQMMNVAMRRFQEVKMERNAWTVEIAYLPGLELNQVVQFDTPETYEGVPETVTGLLTDMSVDADLTAPTVMMKLLVLSFEELGATTYTNDVIEGEQVGMHAMYSDQSSGGGSAEMVDGQLDLQNNTSGQGEIDYDTDMGDTDAGTNYLLSFNWSRESGTGDLTVEIHDGNGLISSDTFSSTGTDSVTYSVTDPDVTVKFIVPSHTDATRCFVWNVALRKVAIR